MITVMLAVVFFSFVDFVVSLIGAVVGSFGLPVSLPSQITDAISTLSPLWNQLQTVFPMDVLFTVLNLVIATEATLLVIRGLMWLLKKLPGIS